jgi:tRNA-guanine family transglycosylase
MNRVLRTAKGTIALPTFFPVTTFGRSFQLDELVRPHLDRFCSGLLASLHYVRHLKSGWHRPLFIDSGGFASLIEGSYIIDLGGCHGIETVEGSFLHPYDVLSVQQKLADIGATLDFIISPSMHLDEAQKRQDLTVRNALWALGSRTRANLFLFASIQAWDAASARRIMQRLASHSFDGFALGGMVPHMSNPDLILEIVDTIRTVEPERPLHVFGIGSPKIIRRLFDAGADSSDSSTYVRQAISGRYLDPASSTYRPFSDVAHPRDCCSCAVCQTFGSDYLSLEGPLNRMALALHNLHALLTLSGLPVSSFIHPNTN